MVTTKRRLNISLSNYTNRALAKIAERDQVPQATKAAHLIEIALELEEDQVWDALASKRDKKKTHFISHENAWA